MDADAVIARAIEVFGISKKAAGGLDDPNRVLGGATPRSLLDTSGHGASFESSRPH